MVYVKHHQWAHGRMQKRMHIWKVFLNLPTTAFTFCGLSLHSETTAPITREKQECFSVTTPFNFVAGVKDQTQHLETISRPLLPTSCFHISNL